MADIGKITEGMRGSDVAELLDRNFKSLETDIMRSNTNIDKVEKKLKERGYIIIEYKGSAVETRLSIPNDIRIKGLTITYNNAGRWIQEQYIGNIVDDEGWMLENNWKSIGGGAGGFIVLEGVYGSAGDARGAVKNNERKPGVYITYYLIDTWTTEEYTGADVNNESWNNEDNWKLLVHNEQIEDIARQAQKAGEEASIAAGNANKAATDAQAAAERAEQAVDNMVVGFNVKTIRPMTKDEFKDLEKKDENTLYIITD